MVTLSSSDVSESCEMFLLSNSLHGVHVVELCWKLPPHCFNLTLCSVCNYSHLRWVSALALQCRLLITRFDEAERRWCCREGLWTLSHAHVCLSVCWRRSLGRTSTFGNANGKLGKQGRCGRTLPHSLRGLSRFKEVVEFIFQHWYYHVHTHTRLCLLNYSCHRTQISIIL